MSRFARLAPWPQRPPQVRVYQLPAEEIGFLTSLVEASDGIALVRTLDQTRGIVECWAMPDYAAEFDRLIEALRREFPIQSLGRDFD